MIKVLVVDDSAYMRHVLGKTLGEDPQIQVVDTARDGLEALAKIPSLKPDVVTLDLEMPRMDGFAALRRIMSDFPLPVIILSSLSQEGADATIQALKLGAVDFVPKPIGGLTLQSVREELLRKVKQVSGLSASKLRIQQASPRTGAARTPRAGFSQECKGVVVIGSSTGGPRALHEVIPRLPGSFPLAVLVVQHMPAGFTRSLAHRLDEVSALVVKEAEPGDIVQPGLALIAPGDHHMRVSRTGAVSFDQGPTENGVRPAVDVTMESAAQAFGATTIGVILTGMGHDGTRGAGIIRDLGGKVIVEDESSCVVYGMPRSAVEAGVVDRSAPLSLIASEIVSAAGKVCVRPTRAFLERYSNKGMCEEADDRSRILVFSEKNARAHRN